MNEKNEHSLGHQRRNFIHQIERCFLFGEMQSHYCANDNEQALKMSWIDSIADSINELTDSFLPRAYARLPYECEHFFVMIGVGVLLFDEF